MTGYRDELIFDALPRSKSRPFLVASGGDKGEALRLYALNGALAGALLTPLGTLEGAIGDAMHSGFTERCGRPDWWLDRGLRLNRGSQFRLVRAEERAEALGQDVHPESVVDQLEFGFWSTLLGQPYEKTLWLPVLHHVFPGQRRVDLHTDLDRMVRLRNAITHHRRIYHWDLESELKTIIRLIECVSPAMAAWTQAQETVTPLLSRRRR